MSVATAPTPEARSAAGILVENVRGVLTAKKPSGAPRIELHPLTQAKLAIHDTPRVFTEWSQQGERLVQLQLGPLRAFLATHPDDAKAVLQDKHRSFAKNTPAFSKMRLVFGNGLVTSQGEFWLRQRRLIQPSFAKDRLGIYARHMTPAIAHMEATLPSGREVDAMQAMAALALELVMTTLLGSQSPSETDEISESLTWLMHDIEARRSVHRCSTSGPYTSEPHAPEARDTTHRSRGRRDRAKAARRGGR